jgi:hypothetical protein
MKNYVEITTSLGHTVIQYEENGFLVSIPIDPSNSDYQAYLHWLEDPESEQSAPVIP